MSLKLHLDNISNDKYMFCYDIEYLASQFFCIPPTPQQQHSWRRKTDGQDKTATFATNPYKEKPIASFIMQRIPPCLF